MTYEPQFYDDQFWNKLMKYKCICGFEYCIDDGTPTYCGKDVCIDVHYKLHKEWEETSNKPPTYYTAPKPVGSIFIGKPRLCPSCEEQINVTTHICKKIDLSVDWLDIMRKLP